MSACLNCMALREDQIDQGAVVPHGFRWHGVCGGCMQTVLFEGVGIKRPMLAEVPPDDWPWNS